MGLLGVFGFLGGDNAGVRHLSASIKTRASGLLGLCRTIGREKRM
jgi:hypothetical protein